MSTKKVLANLWYFLRTVRYLRPSVFFHFTGLSKSVKLLAGGVYVRFSKIVLDASALILWIVIYMLWVFGWWAVSFFTVFLLKKGAQVIKCSRGVCDPAVGCFKTRLTNPKDFNVGRQSYNQTLGRPLWCEWHFIVASVGWWPLRISVDDISYNKQQNGKKGNTLKISQPFHRSCRFRGW